MTLTIPNGSPDYAVAYICPAWPIMAGGMQVGQFLEQFVLQQNIADGSSFTRSCPQTPALPQTGTLTGNVDASAIAGSTLLNVQATNGTSTANVSLAGAVSDFSFAAPVGSNRVEVLAYDSDPSSPVNLLAAKTFDDQVVPGALNGGNSVVLGAADQTVVQAITYQNVPSGFAAPTVLVNFFTGTSGLLHVASGVSTTYRALPAGAVRNGDSYDFLATVYQNQGGLGLGAQVLAKAGSKTGGPMTFSFPSAWSYGGPVPAAMPAFDFTYAGFSGSNATVRNAAIGWSSGTVKPGLFSFFVVSTGNYAKGSTRVTFPDLSGITGFLPAPPSGTVVSWLADTADLSPQGAPSGTEWLSVRNQGTYTVP